MRDTRPAVRVLPLVLFAALGGCIKDASPPNPGKCAEGPPGKAVWTWGEIRIGTCLSGPADMHFYENGSGTYLAVTNANPYIDYSTGSLLMIDWDSIDLTKDINYMHELDAGAIPIDDYVGGFGVMPSREQIMVSGRKSEGASGRDSDDRVYLIDVDQPLNPRRHAPNPRIAMRDDPFPIVIDEPAGRAYVGHLTDHSVAVFDITTEEPTKIDVAPGTVISLGDLDDADASGSVAVVDSVDVLLAEDLKDDLWTLDWIDGTARVWVPEPSAVEGEIGLQRYTDVGIGPVASALGNELDFEDVGAFRDASFATLDAPFLFFVDSRGTVVSIANSGTDGLGAIGAWSVDTLDTELTAGGQGAWDAILGSPEVEIVDDLQWLFYDGRTSTTQPAVGFSIETGDLTFPNPAAPTLSGDDFDGFLGFEDPTAWHDPAHDSVLLWVTAILDDGSTAIALSETVDNGLTWSEPEIVIEEPGVDLSNPVVHRRHGRFEIWYTRDDGAGWTHAHASSFDGLNWVGAVDYLVSPLPYDAATEDPAVAVQVDDTAAWRVEGRDQGGLGVLAIAGTTFLAADQGFALRVSSGHEFPNSIVPDGRARVTLSPGSYLEIGGVPTLYVTQQDESRKRLGVLQQIGGSWVSVASDLIPPNQGGNKAGVSDPVVFEHGGGFTMFYAATSAQEITTIRRATSTDGLNWSPSGGAALVHDDDWDAIAQLPHSVEQLDDGSIRLWYSGDNGSRQRIGSATAAGPNAKLGAEVGEFDPWRFEPGVPGSFDDGGVRDPFVFTDLDEVTHLLYAGFDGQTWSLGHATQNADGSFDRRIDSISDRSLPSMPAEEKSFSAAGNLSPVLVSQAGGEIELFYAGFDGFSTRVGRAVGRPDRQWPAMRYPTVGDQLTFSVEQGRTGTSVIELAQETETFISPGIGMSGMTHDTSRGVLYIPSKLETYVYVVDVRDDSGGALDDANALDLEGVFAVTNLGAIGFRDVLVDDVRDRLYMTARSPDGLVVVDLNRLTDDDAKEVTWYAPSAVLPLQDAANDPGDTTISSTGGAGMTITPDNRYLIVAHHRGNGVSIFDLDRDAWGAEVAWVADIGENPHIVRLSPDGRHAVVANYVGEIFGQASSSTLAILDVDPTSETFGEVVTWLANR